MSVPASFLLTGLFCLSPFPGVVLAIDRTIIVSSGEVNDRLLHNIDQPIIPETGFGTLETGCPDSIWIDISTRFTASINTSAPCTSDTTSTGYNGYCGTACCASHNQRKYGGRLCTADRCAWGISADNGGQLCMGTECARKGSNNCPVSTEPGGGTGSCLGCNPAYSQNNYELCCASNIAEGCIGTSCGRDVHSDYGSRYCLGESCARDTIGYEAGHACQGNNCARNCTGTQCGAQCYGDNCAMNATGNNAGNSCTGKNCANNASGVDAGAYCIGDSCAANCKGRGCGKHCTGEKCAYNCSGMDLGITSDNGTLACGAFAHGKYAAEECWGHGCGKHCSGYGCAKGATSSFTSTTFAGGGIPTSTIQAMNCYREWVFDPTGINPAHIVFATTFSPTAAPTVLPTALTSAPTSGAPTTATSAPTTSPTDVPTTSPTDNPTVTTFAPTFAPTATPTYAPTGYPTSSVNVEYSVGTFSDNSSCNLMYPPLALRGGFPDDELIHEGPGHACSGEICAKYSVGAFAGSLCSGAGCAENSIGIFAGVACVGTNCAKNASGPFAGSFCYGTNCASGSTGNWSGAYCIGNSCASSVSSTYGGSCCIGLNCHSSANTASSCVNEGNGGTPYNLGASSIYKYECRRNIDTESTAWLNFFTECVAQGASYTTPYNPHSSCSVTCTEPLSQFLSYYLARQKQSTYASLYNANNIKYRYYVKANDDNTEKDNLIISVAVLGSVIVIVIVAFAIKAAAAAPSAAAAAALQGTQSNIYEDSAAAVISSASARGNYAKLETSESLGVM